MYIYVHIYNVCKLSECNNKNQKTLQQPEEITTLIETVVEAEVVYQIIIVNIQTE